MKRIPVLGILLLIPALMLFGMVGCTTKDGGKDKAGKDGVASDKGADKGGDKDKQGKKTPIATALDATVTGTVKLKGKAPEMPKIAAIAKHGDAKVCLMGDDKEQTWHVNNDGRVANVVIILGPPADKKFKIDDEVKKLSKKTVYLDQPFCQYVPHVVGIYPDAQSLVAKNSAKLNHNTKIVAGGDAGTVDRMLAEGKETEAIKLTGLNNETLIEARCSIHGWMTAKIPVFSHPYFSVTNDKGEFKIENVPIDTELTVYMWHESMGDLKSKVEQKKMSFKKGDNSLGELEIAGK